MSKQVVANAGVTNPEKLSRVDALVLSTVNAPYTDKISASELAQCLKTCAPSQWLAHFVNFFTDIRVELILAFADEHGISRAQLAKAHAVAKSRSGEFNPGLEAALVPLAALA